MKAKEIINEAMGNLVKVPVAVMLSPNPGDDDDDAQWYEFFMEIGRKDLAIALGYLLENTTAIGPDGNIHSSAMSAEYLRRYQKVYNKKVKELEKKVIARYKNNQL